LVFVGWIFVYVCGAGGLCDGSRGGQLILEVENFLDDLETLVWRELFHPALLSAASISGHTAAWRSLYSSISSGWTEERKQTLI
jgi:hypothetical protein